jgi:hypothetical protein
MAHPHKDKYRNRYYALEGGCSLYKCDKCGSGPMHIKDGFVSSEPCWACEAVAWRELTEKEFMLETYLCDDLNLESSFTYCQPLPFPNRRRLPKNRQRCQQHSALLLADRTVRRRRPIHCPRDSGRLSQ